MCKFLVGWENLIMTTNWQCLESNPDALNQYIKRLGFNIDKFQFYDLFSTEDWAKDMIPKPVLGVLLVFPCNETAMQFKKQEFEQISKEGQFVSPDLFFMKQFALNSCGSVGIYHILLNLQNQYKELLPEDSIINKFKNENTNQTVENRSKAFNESEAIKSSHVDAVKSGTTPDFVENNNHFVAFLNFSSVIYEMDGTKEFPINHGPTTEETFLDNACNAIRKFMERDPENVGFSLICLALNNAE